MSAIGENILANARYKACLPKDFLFGAASASHQIEGNIDADGKGPNVWDVALADREGNNGKDACDSYVQWKRDVDLLKLYGMNCYRFSISWARVIPLGKLPCYPWL
jgi:beta-glucosidase/6-phospho-beta-glucosidase/beta-galactosidase